MPDDVKAESSTATATEDEKAESSAAETEKDAEGSESSTEESELAGLKPKTAERIQELLADRREAQSAIAALQERIDTLEAERGKGEPKTEEQIKAEALKREARQKLEEIYPELREMREERDSLKKQLDEDRGYRDQEAMTETVRLAREAGIPASEAERVSKVLAGIIAADPALLREFRRGSPKAAVREAFSEAEAFLGKIGNRKKSAETQKNKEKLGTLPKTHTSGGTAGEGRKAEEPIKSIKDADRRVREILAKAGKE